MRLRGCALGLAFLLAPGAVAQDPRSREGELEAIRDEISGLESRLAAVRQRQSGLAGDLERVEVELELQEKRFSEAVAARALAAERAAATELEVFRLQGRLAELQGQLRRSLNGLYRLGRHGYLRLFLSLRPNQSLLPGIRLLRLIARRDAETLDRFRDTRTRLEFERDQLQAGRRELEAWVRREEGRRQGLVALRARQAELLAAAQGEGRRLAARTGELREKERKLSALLDFLYGRVPDALAGRPIQGFRGVLDWPVRGRITAGFGPRLDPRYKTRVPHNGVDIATQKGSEVRAVYPGKVIYAAPFEGYGQAVVLHHSGRALTLYAGLTQLRVAKDDVVKLNAVLGAAGDTIYFEIRVENRPENPALWLR